MPDVEECAAGADGEAGDEGAAGQVASKVSASRPSGRNPVRAIHNFDQEQAASISAGQSRKPGSPVPIMRKSSPRSSPRTSPLPHRGSSPAGRSPSPHHFRTSPRASPVASGAWVGNGGVVRNKSAFNKVKSSKQRQAAFQPTELARGVQSDSARVHGADAQGPLRSAHVPLVLSASVGGAASRNTRSPVLVAGSARGIVPGSPLLGAKGTASPGPAARPTSSSKRQDPTSRDLEFLMGTHDDDEHEEAAGAEDEEAPDDGAEDPGFGSDNELIYYGEHSRNARLEGAISFGPSRRRPASSNASSFADTDCGSDEAGRPKSCSAAGARSSVMAIEIAAASAQLWHTQQAAHKSPVSLQSGSVADGEDAEGLSGADGAELRGRLSDKQRWRQRSSSWDAVRSRDGCAGRATPNSQIAQASHTREQIKLQKKQELKLQLQQYQIKHELEQQQLQQQRNKGTQHRPRHQASPTQTQSQGRPSAQHPKLHGAVLKSATQPPGEEESNISLDTISGMSLEDVFKLERMLNAYKSQLLRDRVLGNPPQLQSDGGAQHSERVLSPASRSKASTPRDTMSVASVEFDTMLENEYLVQRGNGTGYAPPHPPSRCNSGNCIFDDMDDNVLGSMEDYENNYIFSQDDHPGSRAPHMKMFKSCDRNASGYISPGTCSLHSTSGTPVSMDGGELNSMESLVQQISDGVSNLSRSPGNLSFVSRTGVLRPNTPPIVARISSPSHAHQQVELVKHGMGIDPSKGVESISSPRSAFSKAQKTVAHASGATASPHLAGLPTSPVGGQQQGGAAAGSGGAGSTGRPTAGSRPIRVSGPARGRANVIS